MPILLHGKLCTSQWHALILFGQKISFPGSAIHIHHAITALPSHSSTHCLWRYAAHIPGIIWNYVLRECSSGGRCTQPPPPYSYSIESHVLWRKAFPCNCGAGGIMEPGRWLECGSVEPNPSMNTRAHGVGKTGNLPHQPRHRRRTEQHVPKYPLPKSKPCSTILCLINFSLACCVLAACMWAKLCAICWLFDERMGKNESDPFTSDVCMWAWSMWADMVPKGCQSKLTCCRFDCY